MIQVCKFCPERDIQKVIPSMSVDLHQAIETGVVLDTSVIQSHNDIHSPDAIVTRVKDTFHALELKKSFLEAGRISGASMSGSTETSTTTVMSSASGTEVA